MPANVKWVMYKDMGERALQHLENASLDQIKTFGDWILCLSAIADSAWLINTYYPSQKLTIFLLLQLLQISRKKQGLKQLMISFSEFTETLWQIMKVQMIK